MKFTKLTINQAAQVWNKIEPLIEVSLRNQEIYIAQDLYTHIESGVMQLWIAESDEILGAVVTSVNEGSKGRKLDIVELAGKDLKDWIPLMENELTDFAKINKCAIVQAITRIGFSKFAPKFVRQNDAVLHIKRIA